MRTPMRSSLAIVGAVLLAGAAAAQPKEYKPPAPQVVPALDKVAMTAFVCDPTPIPPGTTQVTLRVTIKNVTGGLQGVTLSGLKIRVLRTNPQPDVLELETTVNNLAPGASQTVGAHVNVGPGVREYFARVDPDDILHEPIVQRANNESRLKLTIPQVSRDQAPPPGSTPPKETRVLDYNAAKAAGAQFANNVEGATTCENMGQFAGPQTNITVVFRISCLVTGGRATPEAFTGFLLKHGWTVKDFQLVDVDSCPAGVGCDWQWRKTPSIGTADASMKMHVWANAGGRQVYVPVRVTIEGPAGTNPYQ